jgi:hypothetical protein
VYERGCEQMCRCGARSSAKWQDWICEELLCKAVLPWKGRRRVHTSHELLDLVVGLKDMKIESPHSITRHPVQELDWSENQPNLLEKRGQSLWRQWPRYLKD